MKSGSFRRVRKLGSVLKRDDCDMMGIVVDFVKLEYIGFYWLEIGFIL